MPKNVGRAVRKGNEIAKLYADDKVDVIIYAVEKSLDSYKFNLLHCKQTFINQLKSGAMGARTIDEGAMDEKSGMNFSEYMAILSGDTDLLEKAKLEKKVAALERIPKLIEQYKEKNVVYERDLPILQATVNSEWKKEDELKALKLEVSALDRKIQLELAPPTPVSEEQEQKQETESPVHIVQPPDSRQHIQPFKGLKI